MPTHSLTNSEIQKYYQNKPKFNGTYLRIWLSKLKDIYHIRDISSKSQ